MSIYKYGFPSSMGVDAAKAQALGMTAADTGLAQDLFEVEDATTPDHEANNEILIRVTEKQNPTPEVQQVIFPDGE